jgi:hypothetical protein
MENSEKKIKDSEISEKDLMKIAKKRIIGRALFSAHLWVFFAVNALIYIINYVNSSNYWYAPWVTTGWALLLIPHAFFRIYPKAKFFSIHLMIFVTLNSYLLFVDYYSTGRLEWFWWPLGCWGILLLCHLTIRSLTRPKWAEDQAKSWLDRKIDEELRKIHKNKK